MKQNYKIWDNNYFRDTQKHKQSTLDHIKQNTYINSKLRKPRPITLGDYISFQKV